MTDVTARPSSRAALPPRSPNWSSLRCKLGAFWTLAESSARAQRWAVEHALALSFFAAALWIRIGLDYIIPERLPVVTFFPAVLLAAYFCSLWPSIVVLVLSAAATALWATTPDDPAILRVVAFLLFVVLVGITIFMIQTLKRTLERIQQHEAQLALVKRELKHRIKNLFTIANSVCAQTMKLGGTVEDMGGRLCALAAAQDHLSIGALKGADVHDLISALVLVLAPEPRRVSVEGPSALLPAEGTTSFALVLHELATNAVKHGAWSGDGRVNIKWSVVGRTLHFHWREEHVARIDLSPRQGLGSALIKSGLPSAIVHHQIRADGLDCRIELPCE